MNELFIRIMASLNRATSRANIQKDVTQLERTPFIIKLQGQLDKSRTAARLRRDLQQAGKNQTISVDAKVSRSSLERSLDEARQQIHTEPIEIPVTADSAALQNAGQAQRDIINSGSGLRNIIQNYVNWNRVLDLVVQAMKKAVSTSSELAKAQTELQIVTGKSNSEMQSLMSGYNALAQDLSVTTTDITSAADEWLRTGKSISDTEKLITDSTILAKIGQLDTAEATKYLTSMMKGFKVETDDVIGIVDRLSAVDMAAAVTSGGLAEAMSKCANSAEIANISMDSLVGYIAAVKEVTQDSDSVVGNAFKSMFSRMGNVKLGKFIDENGEDISGEINNVEKLLSHFGISLRTSATEFRDFEDVIYDVGMAWDKFSSVEKNTIASTFGGTYQREKVTALFENFDRALELTEVSANSAGTAIKKYAVYQDGLEASVNRLTSAFESLAYNTVSQDFLKGLADGAAGIVEFVDKTKLIQTSLTALTFTGAVKGLLLLGTRLVAVKANLNDVTTAMGLAVRSEQLNAAENNLLAQSFSRLTTAQQNLVLSNKKLSTEQRIAILTSTGLTRAEAEARLQTIGLVTAENTTAKATFNLRGAWEALKVSIASNPVGLIVTALTSATMIISACTEKQNEYNQKIQETAEQAKQEMSEISDLYSQYRDLSKEVETDSDKKTDLIKVTDDLLEKLGYEKNAIDDLIEKYGNLDDAINAITLGGLEEAEGSLKQAYGLAESSLAPGLNPFEDIFSTNENQKKYEFNFQGAYKSEIESMLKKSGLLDDNSRFGLNMGKIRLNGNVDSIDDMVKNYQDLSDMIILLNKSFSSDELADDGIYQALVSEQTILKTKVDSYNSAISDLNDNIAQQQILTSLMGKELPSTQEEFDKFKDSLLESAESSEEWSNKFVGGTDSAKEAIISALKNKPEFIEFFKNEIPDATDDADDGLTRVAETISNLSKKLDDFMDSANVFSTALEKIITKTGLTFEELNKLLALDPELFYSVSKSEDGTYTFDKNAVISSANKYGESHNPYKEAYENSQQEVTDLENQLTDLEAMNNDPRISNSGLTQQINNVKSQLKAAQQEFDGYKLLYDGYNETIQKSVDSSYLKNIDTSFSTITTEVNDKVGDYNTGIKNLQKAIDSIAKGKALDYDSVTELIKSFPELNDKVREGADGFYIESDALNYMLDISYKARNEFIENEKTKTSNAIEQAKQRIQVWQIELNILEKCGELESDRANELTKLIDSANKSIEDNKSISEWLDSLTGKVYTSTAKTSTDKSVSTELQNQIDYYNTIIQAVEALSDKKIKALNNEKDALKDKNDEQQRELDLIEAQNNLDKAKKQKVFVYKEGEGLVQVQDEKAVKDAQKNLDDVQTNIKEADIDKQIEALNTYKDSFSDMESNAKDQLAIEQAKKVLGVDENGLLNLDGKTASEIQNGLAEAIYNKDLYDNKDNDKYVTVTFDDFLKSLGAKVNADGFSKIINSMYETRPVPIADKVRNSTENVTNNSSVSNISNKRCNIYLSPTIEINNPTNPEEVTGAIKTYLNKTLRTAINSIK